MNRDQAILIRDALHDLHGHTGRDRNEAEDVNAPVAEAWQSGGGIWLVTFTNHKGEYVCISDEAICTYADEAEFYNGERISAIEIY